ncbi:MAG: MFS transporter [Candidatus Dadabacteria bacterium]|nr:MFS transporter [Candidatus Dadabacteria bacterium]TDI91911.1 MAG: MFS transporter [Candidatus Dadabacteria bacterium]TDJ01044.1 MAG: MFS transporter [Candidatus Dadabacteria bacterium]
MPIVNSHKNKRGEILSWCMYDWANSAFATTVMAAVLPVYYSQVAGVNLPGNTATVYWGYTTAGALLISAFLAPIMGAIADYSGTKKKLLMTFAALGIFATALLYFVTTGDWLMASVFFILGNIGFATSEVFYNSLLPHIASPEKMDQVSTKGYALGYLGGGILLGINVLMIELMSDKILATRLSFVTVSIWWAIFTIPILRNVREPKVKENIGPHINPLTGGFKRVATTFKELRSYRELFLFLVAFWIYNDGIGTIIKMATIYGVEIGIDQTTLIGALLMTQFVGIPFSFAFGRLAKYIGTKNSILFGLFVYTMISIGGYFMETALHFWILAFLVGTVQGGTQALSRSLFGSMLPKSKTGEFYGFYGMSSKFAGIIGPLVFAIVSQIAGSSRLSILSLIVFFILGAFLLSRVDEKKGIENAQENSI